ncbi:MAG: hypothetical protein KDA20_13390, partial [Phycisphaerales bacterium]|nr:hypothetical protein [Phycisphaerales bacterium]
MRHKKYGALIALNASLVGVLLLVSLPAGAEAQQGTASTRGRGNYTMVAGQIQGSSEDAVWIVDAANEEIMAMRWDLSRQDVQFLGFSPFSMSPNQ